MFKLMSVTPCAFAACLVLAAQANAAYPPARDTDTHALPSHAVPGTCSATGTWFDQTDNGPGSWSKTTALKCKIKGVWTDSFGYTWTVKAGPKHTLTGTVNYNNVVGCTDQVWPFTGTRKKKTFMVTATNPDNSDPNCEAYFGYTLTLQ